MSFADYLIGSAGLVLGTLAILYIGMRLTRLLVPGWRGPVAWVGTLVLSTASALVLGEILGSFGLYRGWIYLAAAVIVALVLWRWLPGRESLDREVKLVHVPASLPLTWIGIGVAAIAISVFAVGVRVKLGTGMTGFDSTWYHGPFAAGFAESGHTFQLHQLAPQFLTWFYPQNSELFHSLGMLAFGNDLVSPLLNLGWMVACLLAAWCIGRPYGGAPISLAGVAIMLASTAMADQSGEARNDMIGTFFLLAALAVMINAAAGGRRLSTGPLILTMVAAGLAAGTKVNFLPAALAIGAGAVVLSPHGQRLKSAAIGAGGLVIGGGYWYLRNLAHSGNPLPWINHIGPFDLPGPAQDVGGRDAGSVGGYLGDPSVIRHWFFPGFADGLGDGWILLLAISVASLVFCLMRGSGPARRTGAAVCLAIVFAWLVAPTSASGPAGSPTGFVSGLRYLAPALAVAMALLGSAVAPRGLNWRIGAMGALLVLAPFTISPDADWNFRYLAGAVFLAGFLFLFALALRWAAHPGRFSGDLAGRFGGRTLILAGAGASALLLAALAFYPIQRSYFDHRYENAQFSTPGLNGAIDWAQHISGASIATNATRQYPFFGRMLGNQVQYIGKTGPEGEFTVPENCRDFREAVNTGEYDYVVTTLDREGIKRDFPPEAAWTASDPAATQVYRRKPTVIFRLSGPLDPDSCPS